MLCLKEYLNWRCIHKNWLSILHPSDLFYLPLCVKCFLQACQLKFQGKWFNTISLKPINLFKQAFLLFYKLLFSFFPLFIAHLLLILKVKYIIFRVILRSLFQFFQVNFNVVIHLLFIKVCPWLIIGLFTIDVEFINNGLCIYEEVKWNDSYVEVADGVYGIWVMRIITKDLLYNTHLYQNKFIEYIVSVVASLHKWLALDYVENLGYGYQLYNN